MRPPSQWRGRRAPLTPFRGITAVPECLIRSALAAARSAACTAREQIASALGMPTVSTSKSQSLPRPGGEGANRTRSPVFWLGIAAKWQRMTDGVGFPKQEAQQLQPKEKL